jgi:putative chitinase
MTIQRKYFFDSVRSSLFAGHLSQSQVDGLNAMLDFAEKVACDDRHLAYILATTFHETAQTMQPIEEYGKGQGHSYGEPDPQTGQCYYGRGYVQLTWKDNYQKQDTKLKLGGALVKNADLALDQDTALKVIFSGMYDGDFTGVGLPKYVVCSDPETDETDFYNARKIVNGLDCATLIQGYAQKFANAITHAAATRALSLAPGSAATRTNEPVPAGVMRSTMRKLGIVWK